MNPPEARLLPDRLSALLDKFRVRASLFHSGALCGRHAFEAKPGRAFLHVLRSGAMEVRHARSSGVPNRLRLSEPTLLLYPRPVHHEFVNPPSEGSGFTCAALDFDGGERNPLVVALPTVVCVPVAEVDGLRPALDLLFAEADQRRCGSSLLVDRMFEVVLIQLLRWIIDRPDQVGVRGGLLAGLADARLARALVAMHRSPGDPWSLDRMASEAGLSRSAFAGIFKSVTGMTPAAYLTDWRLTVATSMIRGGQAIKFVSDALGFAGSASFSKAFKQRFGSAPRDWAKSQVATHAG